jgi:hypothetical protein
LQNKLSFIPIFLQVESMTLLDRDASEASPHVLRLPAPLALGLGLVAGVRQLPVSAHAPCSLLLLLLAHACMLLLRRRRQQSLLKVQQLVPAAGLHTGQQTIPAETAMSSFVAKGSKSVSPVQQLLCMAFVECGQTGRTESGEIMTFVLTSTPTSGRPSLWMVLTTRSGYFLFSLLRRPYIPSACHFSSCCLQTGTTTSTSSQAGTLSSSSL